MIECSCRVLTTSDFKRAVEGASDAIIEAGSLRRAVGLTYNAARENKPSSPCTKSCTTCLPSLAQRIQEAGHYKDEIYVALDRFKNKSCQTDCSRCPAATASPCPSAKP